MKRLDVLLPFYINIVEREEHIEAFITNHVLQLLYAFDCKIA